MERSEIRGRQHLQESRIALRSIRATSSSPFRQPHAKPSGEVLHILPGDAARTRTTRRRPFERLALELLALERDAVVADVALHHGEVFVLAAAMEAKPEAEAIRQRDLFLDRLAGIDRGCALILDHLARHQVAAVRGRVEYDVVGPAFDAALEHRLERLNR